VPQLLAEATPGGVPVVERVGQRSPPRPPSEDASVIVGRRPFARVELTEQTEGREVRLCLRASALGRERRLVDGAKAGG
jgi:hypothetical protein